MKDTPIIESTTLEYTEGTSDKVYIVNLHEFGAGRRSDLVPGIGPYRFGVNCVYGRRGAVNRESAKAYMVSEGDARRIYNKTISEKKSKGYVVTHSRSTYTEVKPEEVKPEFSLLDNLTCTVDDRQKALARLRGCA